MLYCGSSPPDERELRYWLLVVSAENGLSSLSVALNLKYTFSLALVVAITSSDIHNI